MKKLNVLKILASVPVLLLLVATHVQGQEIHTMVKCGAGKIFYSGDPAHPNKNFADRGDTFIWHIVVDKPNTEVIFYFDGTSPFAGGPTYSVPVTNYKRYSLNVSTGAGNGTYHYTITCKEPESKGDVIDPIIEIPKPHIEEPPPPQTQTQP